MNSISTIRRAWRFYMVGALGIAVQLGMLTLLTHAGLYYVAATVLAVEAAVIHNFVWHQHYTWGERLERGPRAYLWRLLKFNSTTGLVSIGGNVLLMRLLVGEVGLRPLLANVISIASCSLVNFLVSDRAVFRPSPLVDFEGDENAA
jgi:putative flippase GtrA